MCKKFDGWPREKGYFDESRVALSVYAGGRQLILAFGCAWRDGKDQTKKDLKVLFFIFFFLFFSFFSFFLFFGRIRLYPSSVGAFGATASVSSFLRIAASIKYMGTVGLHLVWTHFFDDYTAVCTETAAQEVTFCVESLLKLLGIKFVQRAPRPLTSHKCLRH